ncbi:hypothetical protein BJY01DRAFT_221191 [Aspergillus pseudoustus]|uniref:F-box domain-containing protein n=1 Tax=Aspergillus pseudoustus TaxID=1810923 RepID=A0ABR4JB22_9EURO
MVLLQDLPTEILSRILALLPEYDGDALGTEARIRDPKAELLPLRIQNKALLSLCLVSHRFRDLAQPLLFRYFQWDDLGGNLYDDDSEDNYDPANADEFRALLLFAKAILRRPELGEHVKFLSIDSLLDETPISFPSFGPDGQKLFADAIKQVELSNKQKKLWADAPTRCDVPILLALVIKQCPNLRGLRFPVGYHILERLNAVWKSDPSLMSKLDSVWISADEEEFYWYQIAPYADLLALPYVKSSTFEYGTLAGGSFPAIWKPGTLAIEEIAFAHCHIDAPAIKKFLASCKRVKSITFQNFSFYNQDVKPTARGSKSTQFNAADLHAAVFPHKATLEHIHLEFFRHPSILGSIEAYQEFCRGHAKLPSLQDFTSLETLFIQHALLPEHPLFPPSLETLEITDCNSSIREMVAFIAADVKSGNYPRLRKFKVLTVDVTRPIKLPGQRIPVGQTPEQCFLRLRALFDGTDVDFMIHPYEMPRELYAGDGDSEGYDDFGEDDDPYDFQFPPVGGHGHGHGGGGANNGLPAGLLQMMQQAMQNPALAAALLAQDGEGESERSWETEDDDDDEVD